MEGRRTTTPARGIALAKLRERNECGTCRAQHEARLNGRRRTC